MNDYFCAAQERGDAIQETLTEEVSALAESELQDILDIWRDRYPRHQFQGFQGHGMLTLSVKPQIGMVLSPKHHRNDDWQRIDRIPPEARKGAIAALYAEADRICTCWAKLEWRTGTYDGNIYTSPRNDD